MPAGYMYILRCADDTYYTGSTIDLDRRLAQHQSGEGAKYTARRLPVELIFSERYDHVAQAFRRERQVQKWSRRKKEALICGDFTNIQFLAECQNDSHWENQKEED